MGFRIDTRTVNDFQQLAPCILLRHFVFQSQHNSLALAIPNNVRAVSADVPPVSQEHLPDLKPFRHVFSPMSNRRSERDCNTGRRGSYAAFRTLKFGCEVHTPMAALVLKFRESARFCSRATLHRQLHQDGAHHRSSMFTRVSEGIDFLIHRKTDVRVVRRTEKNAFEACYQSSRSRHT